jgi:hypothetical protein
MFMAGPATTLMSSLANEASRVEEDALYSAKGHFEAARAWDHCHLAIGGVSALAAAAAGVSGLNKQPVVAAILAFLASASTALLTFLNPKERAAHHFKAGNLYKILHDDCRLFRLIDCQQSTAAEELSRKLKDLSARRHALNTESPQIPRIAFLRARRGIEGGEAEYKVDRSAGPNTT